MRETQPKDHNARVPSSHRSGAELRSEFKSSASAQPTEESVFGRVQRFIRLRRPLLTALFVLAALGLALREGSRTTSLFRPEPTFWFVLAWVAMLVGVAVRIWGAGNLRKNQEITDTGIYRMVRHPLYLGSLSIFLAYFVAVGDPWLGLALFGMMVVTVYYPTMLREERVLARLFPEQLPHYRTLFRLIPNPVLLRQALASDRFSLRTAYENLGLRSLWVLVLLPLFLELLIWIKRVL